MAKTTKKPATKKAAKKVSAKTKTVKPLKTKIAAPKKTRTVTKPKTKAIGKTKAVAKSKATAKPKATIKTKSSTKATTIGKTKSVKLSVQKSATELLVDAIVFGMEEKKAKEIIALDLRGTGNSIADFFIICHADSRVQVEAIADSINEQVHKKTNDKLRQKEGRQNAEWIILDYFNVVAHIFITEKRKFYNLENLWADATVYLKAVNE